MMQIYVYSRFVMLAGGWSFSLGVDGLLSRMLAWRLPRTCLVPARETAHSARMVGCVTRHPCCPGRLLPLGPSATDSGSCDYHTHLPCSMSAGTADVHIHITHVDAKPLAHDMTSLQLVSCTARPACLPACPTPLHARPRKWYASASVSCSAASIQRSSLAANHLQGHESQQHNTAALHPRPKQQARRATRCSLLPAESGRGY